jgi:hypothetical protein
MVRDPGDGTRGAEALLVLALALAAAAAPAGLGDVDLAVGDGDAARVVQACRDDLELRFPL